MRTHYIGHDTAYQRQKEQGLPGWDTAEGYLEFQGILEQQFQTR